ncbi:MAG TPA: G8 domain-containing protein, partial [Gemmataceae bacterium]
MPTLSPRRTTLAALAALLAAAAAAPAAGPVAFDVRSVRNGNWSDPNTWQPPRVPAEGERVLVSGETEVVYDVRSKGVLRLVHVAGTLRFARDRDTELNVGILKVQPGSVCSEHGFACDIDELVNPQGEPVLPPKSHAASLLVGTPEEPIPAELTARIRLHFLPGMNKDDAPALVCCSGRLELHGAPMSRTWVKLGRDVKPGDATVTLAEPVTGWRAGDEVIVTGSERGERRRSYRRDRDAARTEERTITRVEGTTLHLDRPLKFAHAGSGEFRSEVANLSRNVVVESADPGGVRGHTMYHRYSSGSIRYARFAHLGKEGVLGRYAIHYHLLGDTMRGSSLVGAAIVDSHNRWVTVHGTQYLVVRDCVGYQSVGHGYFLEDGTEVYNLLDRNLGVQAYRGKKLPRQALPFDPNDGAAFWWANGLNTLVRNVACENDEYGYRYDMQHSRYFDARLPVRQPDGSTKRVDVRTLPIWRFEDNESHTEGLYGVVIAGNGNSQPDSPIRDRAALEEFRRIDWTGPDTRHPHVLRNTKLWETHYAFRPHCPSMLIDGLRIHESAYGVYRPAFGDQVYRDVHMSRVAAEPFNRGMDDASAQLGKVTVDGLTFEDFPGGSYVPLIQMTD